MLGYCPRRLTRFVSTVSARLLPLVAALSCSIDLTGAKPTTRRPPYLAVVVFVDAPAGVTSRGPFTFHVREMSGKLPTDTTFSAATKDTVIFHVEPATYQVDISDVPPSCGVRDGTAHSIVVPEQSNTSLVRFFVTCGPSLSVTALTDGFRPDSQYVLGITTIGAPDRGMLLRANDTLRLEKLAAGTYTVSLNQVDPHCVVSNDGGARVAVKVSPAGGTFVAFRVVCVEEARRPRIVQVAATYAASSIGYVIRVVDPDKDVERTFVDVTDCRRKSILPLGGSRRGGFSGYPNVSGRDTATIVGGYDLAIPRDSLQNRCIAVWVADERGNQSDIVEHPLAPRDPLRSPNATFSARLAGISSIVVELGVTDPDNDFLGLFPVYVLRDGIVTAPPDGQPDRLVASPPGTIGSTIHAFPIGIGFGQWSDYLGVVVYLVDRAGNFTRLEDFDLLR